MARRWSRTEILYHIHFPYGTSQLVVRQSSNGKRRNVTKSLVRLCFAYATCAVLSHVFHPIFCARRRNNTLFSAHRQRQRNTQVGQPNLFECGASQAVTEFQREHCPALTVQKLCANAETLQILNARIRLHHLFWTSARFQRQGIHCVATVKIAMTSSSILAIHQWYVIGVDCLYIRISSTLSSMPMVNDRPNLVVIDFDNHYCATTCVFLSCKRLGSTHASTTLAHASEFVVCAPCFSLTCPWRRFRFRN